MALEKSLKPVTGKISIPAAKATLNLGEVYYFLDAADAKRVLTEGWGNPPSVSEDVLGMVFPAGKTFLDETWGAVIRYEDTGHVTDTDADSADYDSFIAEIQNGAAAVNEERRKAGYEPLNVIGWAQPPSYDPQHHDLIWAQDVQFGQEADHSLNYDLRHLGRSGVLSMNMISTMSKLPEIRQSAVSLARTAEFEAGARYADYQSGDKEAGYGLAGLVAAGLGVGVSKKVSLLAGAALFLKKGVALIAAAAAAVVGWFRRFLKRKDV